MKKLLFLFGLLMISFVGFSQAYIIVTTYGTDYKRVKGDSAVGIPTKTSKRLSTNDLGAQIFVFNDSLYYYSHGVFYQVSTGGAQNFDSTSLSNRINGKVNISDTAAMLFPYLRKIDAAALFYPLLSNPANYISAPYLNNLVNLLQVINAGGAVSWASGLFAARPAAGINGRFYFAVDSSRAYFDNGGGWIGFAGGAGGGGVNQFAALIDVLLTSPVTGNLVRYDAALGKWVNFTPTITEIAAWTGFTPENVANKVTTLVGANNSTYPTTLAVLNAIVANTPPNRGTGYRILSPQIPAFNSIICVVCLLDSTTNIGSLTITLDTINILATRSYVQSFYDTIPIEHKSGIWGIYANTTQDSVIDKTEIGDAPIVVYTSVDSVRHVSCPTCGASGTTPGLYDVVSVNQAFAANKTSNISTFTWGITSANPSGPTVQISNTSTGAAILAQGGSNSTVALGNNTGIGIDLASAFSATASIASVANFSAVSTGAAGNGFGQSFIFQLEDASGTTANAGAMETYWVVAAAGGTQMSRMVFQSNFAGTLADRMYVDVNGITSTSTGVGFTSTLSGTGFFALSSNVGAVLEAPNVVLQLENTSTSTSTAVPTIDEGRQGATFNGAIGNGILNRQYGHTSSGTNEQISQVIYKFTDVTPGHGKGEMDFWVADGTGGVVPALQLLGHSSSITGVVIFTQSFANNAAAIAGGLTTGEFYRNGDIVQQVH